MVSAFALLKTWAATHAHRFQPVLRDRFIMYGEWLYAKHTVFYDALPHYFFEFDVFDRQSQVFLSTKARQDLLSGMPIMPVPVLRAGVCEKPETLPSLVKPSLYKSATWRDTLAAVATSQGLDVQEALKKTEDSELSEGLYFK